MGWRAGPPSRSLRQTLASAGGSPEWPPLTPDAIDLQLRREALRFAVQGAGTSVPMLWLAVAIILPPAWQFDGAWPAWLVGSLALASGLWRLVFLRRLGDTARLDATRLARAEWQVQANAALSGLIWATATVVLFPVLDAEQATLHLAVLIGTTAVASYYMSLIGRSFELITVPITLPLVLVALWVQSPHVWEVSLGSLAFFAAMLRGSRHFKATTLLALRRDLETTEANRALAAAKSRLEQEAAAKSRFLDTMTHEIRRPMSGALGALDLLADEPLTPRQSHILLAAREASASLMGALSGLLEHSQLDTGPVPLQPAPLNLSRFGMELAAGHQARASAKGLQLDVDFQPGLPLAVLADRHWLGRVLDILLGNAVRFTERGQVTLRLTPVAEGLRFEVEDSGPGIAAADQAMVFEPFYQVDHGPQRAQTGAGLGLAIARRLVHQMGGEITLRSELGRGSCFGFTLTLPVAANPGPAPTSEASRPPASLTGTVLVVDDDPYNRMVAVEMLQRGGLNVLEATDGLQALDALQRGGISLVLMDGQMPALDGYEATRQWRERETRLGTPRVPIIGVSANTLADHERLAHRSGMDDHLAKPFGMAELMGRVGVWMREAA